MLGIAGVAVVLVAALGATLTERSVSGERRRVLASFTDRAAAFTTDAWSHRDSRIAILAAIASSPVFEQGEPSAIASHLSRVDGSVGGFSAGLRWLPADAGLAPGSDARWFDAARSGDAVAAVVVVQPPVFDREALVFAVPTGGRGRPVDDVLAAGIAVADLRAIASSMATTRATVEFGAVDRHGALFLSSVRGDTVPYGDTELVRRIRDAPAARSLNPVGVLRDVPDPLTGASLVVGWGRVSGSDEVVFLAQPETAAFAEVSSIRRTGALAVGAAVLALLVLAAVLARRADRAAAAQARQRDEAVRARLLLDAVIDSVPDPVSAKDLEGRYIAVNDAARALFGVDDVVGRTSADLLPPEVLETVRAADRVVGREGAARRFEHTFSAGDGVQIFDGVVAPLRDASGETSGVVRVMRDVTADREVERLRDEMRDTEHRLALAVEDALRGPGDFDDDRVEVHGFHRPSTRGLAVGGDWYDVIRLDDGRVAMIVGDVVGHGIASVVAMGQLRSALLGIARLGLDPAEALRALDAYVELTGVGRSSSCIYATLDPTDGTLRWASAGHVPLLVVDPDGDHRLLADAQGAPLAVGATGRLRPEGRTVVAPGAVVVACSDGLVERRGERIDVGLGRLARVVAERRDLRLGALCAAVLDAMSPPGGADDGGPSASAAPVPDDVVLVALRLVRAQGHRYERTIDSRPTRLAVVRRELHQWLADVDDDDRAAIVLVVGEALANSINHAYLDEPHGRIRLRGVRLADAVELTIDDFGSWLDRPPLPLRGHGLPLMRALTDACTIERRRGGTTVTLHKKLARPLGEERS